jgi:signal peptidase I
MKQSHRPLVRVALTAATFVAVFVWALLFSPQFIGGRTAYVIVSGESMEPTLAHGDLVIAHKKSSYEVGDVVAYRLRAGEPGAGTLVIHRIVGGSAREGYVTRGDNRSGVDVWQPKPHEVVGTMWLTVPRAGLVLAYMRTTLGLAILAALATFFFIAAGAKPRIEPDWGDPRDPYSLARRFPELARDS